MVRVYRASGSSAADGSLWSFSYVDWQGRPQTGIGTGSRLETLKLAQQVQAEHDVLRTGMRRAPQAQHEAVTHSMAAEIEIPTEADTFTIDREAAATCAHNRTREAVQDHESPGQMLIGAQLVDSGLITHEQLDDALEHQQKNGGKIIDTLVRLDSLTWRKFLLFMGKQRGIPRIVPENLQIAPEVLKLVPEDIASELELIPIDQIGSSITVAMVCPLDKAAIRRLQQHTGLNVRPMLCSRVEYLQAFQQYYGKKPSRGLRKDVQ